jgi:hypothetical protein
MSKFTIVRFFIALGALSFPYFTELKEPLVKWLLDRYHVRYWVQWDPKQSALAIGLRNASSVTASPVRVDVSSTGGEITDFECGSFPGGPALSFISVVSTLPTFSQLPGDENRQLGRFVDPHGGAMRRMHEISGAWNDVIRRHLTANSSKQPAYDPADIMANHAVLLSVCGSAEKGPCKDERELERWERLEYAMRSEAGQTWEKATGVGVAFNGSEAWPSKDLTFWVVPGPSAEEARFITIHYEPGANEPKTGMSPDAKSLTKVDPVDDLYASTARLVWKYDRRNVLLLGISTLIGLIFAYPLLTRYSKASVDRLFRLVLANPDEEKAWDALYSKLKLALVDDFRQACLARSKIAPALPAIDLFRHLRNRALAENPSFEDEKDVDRFVHMSMGELADHV